MARIPKDIRNFKILFLLLVVMQLVINYSKIYQKLYYTNIGRIKAEWIAMAIGVSILIVFLIYLRDAANILKLNNIIKIKPWILVLLQLIIILHTSKLIIPGVIIPIYIWIKSKKLLQLDAIKTYDGRKFTLPPQK